MVAFGDCTKILLPPESLLDEVLDSAEMSDLAEKAESPTRHGEMSVAVRSRSYGVRWTSATYFLSLIATSRQMIHASPYVHGDDPKTEWHSARAPRDSRKTLNVFFSET